MMIEKQLELDVVQQLQSMPELKDKDIQFVCSRSGRKIERVGQTIVSVACAFRQNDAFSLTPITMNLALVVITRTETDVQSDTHNEVVEAIADKISYWHKYGNELSPIFSNEKFLAGELRMDGGSARSFDTMTNTWRDTFNFSIRGAEKFPAP